jgi:hypothetical protein
MKGKIEMSEHLAERLICGVTTVLLRCAICGDVKTVEMLGSRAATPTEQP